MKGLADTFENVSNHFIFHCKLQTKPVPFVEIVNFILNTELLQQNSKFIVEMNLYCTVQ